MFMSKSGRTVHLCVVYGFGAGIRNSSRSCVIYQAWRRVITSIDLTQLVVTYVVGHHKDVDKHRKPK